MGNMNNLIFEAFAYSNDMESGVNVSGVSDKISLYLKNALVSLTSAKINNPDCDIALITNIEIPDFFLKLYAKFKIMIIKNEFDDFNFGPNYSWGLAFYKLCAIKAVLKKDYKNYLMIDTDTYIQSSLYDLWEETNYNIILYDINHRLSIKNCKKFNDEIYSFTGQRKPLTNYGGEFIAGNKENLTKFIEECKLVFDEMISRKFITSHGDEFIIRIVAEKLRAIIKNGGGYVFRFWTGDFYLSSTCYKYNAVSVLHVPDEKNKGMIKIYSYLISYGHFPAIDKIYKLLHINKKPFKYFIKKVLKHLKS